MNVPVLDLVHFVVPPEDRYPTLVRAGCIGRDDGISTRVTSINPAGNLGFHKDPKVDTNCLHCPQSGLQQSSIATVADIP